MKNIFALTKRNCLLFLRNKATVFFSFLSSLILIVLYFLFIAKLYAQGFNEAAGLALNAKQLNCAIYLQMIAGALVINAASCSIGMFTLMATDLETRKTDALLLTNAKPYQIIISYLISAFLVSFILNFLMLIISIIIIGAATTYWLSAGAFFLVIAALAVTTFVSCAVILLITVLIKSSVAMGVVNGIFGTVLGFLCGIYMPYTNLGTAAKYIGSALPFTHMTIWLKQIVLNDVFGQFGMPADISATMKEMWFSAGNIGLFGANIPLWGMILISCAIAIVCLVLAIWLLRRIIHKKGRTPKLKKVKVQE